MLSLSRRDLLKAAGAAGLVSASPFAFAKNPKEALRVIHMTDFHIQPEAAAFEGSMKAMEKALALKPHLILAGGDLIMDAFAQTEDRTRTQWALLRRAFDSAGRTPILPAIGNHDVWGWNKKDSATDGSERLWGKKWFADFFGQERTYRAMSVGGWRFIALDNILLTPDGYNGMVDAEQMEWLDGELAAHPEPTCILCHIPILTVTSLVSSWNQEAGEWHVGGNIMTKNEAALRRLFAKHAHVKIVLSGHTHMVDRVNYHGISHLCGGAVCGAWWNGSNQGFAPGFRVFDLNADGSFREKYTEWGWKASA